LPQGGSVAYNFLPIIKALCVSESIVHRLDSARMKTDSFIKRFDASLMSNSKWVKLLKVLTLRDFNISSSKIKLVWDEDIRVLNLNDDLEFGFDYCQSSMESMVSGYPKGFYDYKEIEWLEIKAPRAALNELIKNIEQVGKYCVEQSIDSIKIIAYKNT